MNYQPWHPMTNAVDVKHLGKLGEEAGELASAASRCLIQGIYEKEPETGKVNKEWLEDEIADVMANAKLCVDRFGLDDVRIDKRIAEKIKNLEWWHRQA